MDERDLLPASIRYVANFNVIPQFSRIEDRVASLRDFLLSIYKEISTQGLLHKYKVRFRTQKIYT